MCIWTTTCVVSTTAFTVLDSIIEKSMIPEELRIGQHEHPVTK